MNGSKRTISRILAFVMLVSAMFTNVITANADVNDVSLIDSVVSSAAAVIEDIVDGDAEDLEATPAVPEGVNKILSYEDYVDLTDKTPLSGQIKDSYFTVEGDVVTRTNSGIELAKNAGGSISFTVGEGSHMYLYAGSTNGTKNSNVTVENTDTSEKLYDQDVTGTTKDALTFESDLSAGTYKVYTTGSDRAMRIYYLYVVDPTAESEENTEATTADTEAPTEAVTEVPTEETTEAAPPVDAGLNKDTNDGVTPFYTVTGDGTGTGDISVTYDAATGEYTLNDNNTKDTANLFFPLEGTETADKFIAKGTITPLAANNSWTLVQLVYLDESNTTTEVAGIRTSGGKYQLRTDTTGTLYDTGSAIVNGTKAEYEFEVDKTAGTVKLTVDGKSTEAVTAEKLKTTASIAAVNPDKLYIRLTTATAERSMKGTLPTVVIEGAEETSEAPTEAVTEAPTEAPTEAVTEAPTEAVTEAPTEKPSEAVTETPAEETTDAAPVEGKSIDDIIAGYDNVAEIKDYKANDTIFEGLTALIDLPLVAAGDKAENGFTGSDGTVYSYSKALEPNNCVGNSSINGDAISFTAPANGKFALAFKVSSKNKTGTVFGKTFASDDTSKYYFEEFDVKAGETYTAGINGSKIRIFVMAFKKVVGPIPDPPGPVDPTETTTAAVEESTETTTAAAVDETTETTTSTQSGGDKPVETTTEAAPSGEATNWNFRSGSDSMGTTNGKSIQGATGEVSGLLIDATAAGAKWDSTRDDWAQVNAGTKVSIPVPGPCKITVETYGANVPVKMDGKDYKSATVHEDDGYDHNYVNYVYKPIVKAIADQEYVVLEMGANDYIGNIIVTAGEFEEIPPVTEDTTETTTAAPVDDKPIWGNVDDDEDIDATDVKLVHSYVLSPSNIGPADTFMVERADVSGDGDVDSEDVAIILQKVLDSTYHMPVEGTTPPEPPAEGPQPGETYTADFVAEFDAMGGAGAPVDGYTTSDGVISISSPQGYVHDSTHGLALMNGDTITIKVAGNATISVKTCQYGNGEIYNIKNEAGEIIGTIEAKGEADGDVYTVDYIGEATTLTLELVAPGEAYLHAVSVANSAAPLGEAKNFMLWFDDLAYDVEGADGAVTKTVDAGTLTGVVNLVAKEGSVDLGDNTLALVTAKGQGDQDKFNAGKDQFKGLTVLDRTDVNAYWGGKRHTSPNDIPSIPVDGDAAAGSSLVFTPAEDGMLNVWYQSGSFLRIWDFNLDGSRNGYVDDPDPTGNVSSLAITVKAGHVYVLSTTGKTSNLGFVNVEYVKTEPITVSFKFNEDGKYDYSNVDISLTDADLGGKVVATFKAGDGVTAALMNGHSYKLSTNDGGAGALVDGSDTFKVTGEGPYTIDLVEIPDVTLTGKFIGGAAADVKSVTFTSMVSGATYEAELTADGYTASVKPGEYNTTVASDKYYTKDRARVIAGEENVDDIYLESLVKSEYMLPDEVSAPGTALTLNGISANNSTSVKGMTGSTIVVPVNGKQNVTVSGWYSGSWDINGQNAVTTDSNANASSPTTTSYITNGTETSVTINVLADSTYLYWIKVEDVVEYDANKTVLQVPSAEFPTLKDAVAYIRNMDGRPEGEAGRMTIELTADVQEQIVFDAPYITLDGKGHEINWYYGQTGLYYSVDPATGLYDESLFYDKYDKTEGNGSLWGGVAIIRGDYFRTVNTTYRNTFNYEVTDKEIKDGAENRNTVKGIVDETWNVQQYGAKERSNAFYIEAKGIEIDKCKILSTQDTFGRNGSTDGGYSVYVKDSVIGGNTDYICGEFKALFDNCELQWFSFENDQAHNEGGSFGVGYICAPKTNPYVFRNCKVTTRGAEGEGNKVEGLWGRTWGAGSKAYFVNCETNGHIMTEGWGQMNGGDIATAVFGEYGNTENGQPFVTSGSLVPSPAVTDAATIANLTTDNVITAYLGGWTPYFYEGVKDPNEPEVKPTVWVVGDSTVCHYADTADAGLYYKRVGYGDKISDYIYADVHNLALSGRSSKDFIEYPEYTTLKEGIKEGDYLIIGFGHNDEKADDAARYTFPSTADNQTTSATPGSFKNSLYVNYIKLAQDNGATPILCSPIVRRTGSGNWSDNNLHKANNGDYAADCKALAEELGIQFIDLTALTKAKYDELTPGTEATYNYDTKEMTAPTCSAALHSAGGSGAVDNTHLNNYGAKMVAYLFAEAIKTSDSPLKEFVKANNIAPTTADLIISDQWLPPTNYDPTGDECISKLFPTTVKDWYASAFGDLGGDGNLRKTDAETGGYIDEVAEKGDPLRPIHVVTDQADESGKPAKVDMRQGITDETDYSKGTGVGKIAGSSDGMLLYYTPMDATGNYHISGTVTVNAYMRNSQVAFGAIITDAILLDKNQGSTTFPYVAAGVYRPSDIGADITDATGAVTGKNKGCSSYSRTADGKLVTGENARYYDDLSYGDVIKVDIVKKGNTFTTTTENVTKGYAPVTDTYTLDMEGTAYAGFFASRCADITVTDIVYDNEIVE